ncbi:hypothetical protein OAH95_00725 [Burkholderiaceae bacterium]|nr:hypothetical protein [Burkholderiaceae bacterium]
MKKIIALLTVFSSIFFSAGATAQNQPLACQTDTTAGLSWENRQWRVSSFVAEKFILVKTSNGLTNESVAKAIHTIANMVHCRDLPNERIGCIDEFGGALFFSTVTLKGGVSQLNGAAHSDDRSNKDKVTVAAFSCTPF